MEYQSNIKSWVTQLVPKLKNASINSAMLRTIATDLNASNLRRIHNDGLAVDESRIGDYNTTSDLYVNPNKSPRKFKPQGKTDKIVFKTTGLPHKTKYFESYSSFRGSIGRSTSTVNLQLSGKLLKSLKMVQDGTDWLIGFNDDYGSEVSTGNEKHFGKKIWGVTKSDERQIEITVNEFLKKDLNASS